MEAFFDATAEEFVADPTQLNELTDRVLKEVAKDHHPHNRLLPADFVQGLLMTVAPDNAIGSNSQGLRHLLALSCLRGVLIANFPQLAENKLFRAVAANHAQTLVLISNEERRLAEEGKGARLKLAARGVVANQIILKLAQISHTFFPEILRFARVSLELAAKYVGEYEAVGGKEVRVACRLAHNSKLPSAIFKLCSKNIWKRNSFIVLAWCVVEQVKTFLTTCGFTKHAQGIQLYKELLQSFQHFKQQLTAQEIAGLALQKKGEEQGTEGASDAVYLEEPMKVRELTPRFYDEEQAMVLSKLRRKKQKLTKKIESDLRKSVVVKQQQAQVREQVRKEKGQRQFRKQQLIIEKQTVEVKKFNKQIKKVKQTRKGKGKSSNKPSFMTKNKANARK